LKRLAKQAEKEKKAAEKAAKQAEVKAAQAATEVVRLTAHFSERRPLLISFPAYTTRTMRNKIMGISLSISHKSAQVTPT